MTRARASTIRAVAIGALFGAAWTPTAVAALAVLGCHASIPTTSGGGSATSTASGSSDAIAATSGSSQSESSDVDGSSTTLDSGVPGCPDVYDGHLSLTDDFDVESLLFTGRVTGNLTINGTSFVDLSFLSCLHRIDQGRVEIVDNDNLENLAGLEQLDTLGGADDPHGGYILVFDNPALETLGHLESLTTLSGLEVSANPSLTDLGLNDVAFLQRLYLGRMCGTELLNNAALVEIRGLASLTNLRGFEIGQQLALTSLGVLHDIGLHRDPPFPNGIQFWENPSLPYAEIDALVQESGVSSAFHCGSLDDPEPVCRCPNPD